MKAKKTVGEWLADKGLDIAQVAKSSRLDPKVVEAIVAGRYTTSPQQRERVANALGVLITDIYWGSAINVDHMYGHGPQFGRSP